MAYNRNWLKEQIRGYLKDGSVNDYLDTWIDLGAKRVSQVLECFEMEFEIFNSLSIPIASGLDGGNASSTNLVIVDGGDAYSQDPEAQPTEYITVPSIYRRLVQVQALRNGEWYNLRPLGKHDASSYKVAGIPQYYLLEYRRIYPLPFIEGDYRAIFLREVEIPVGDNEDSVLTAYPFIFLSAALAEAYDWKQDPEMNARYEQRWTNEAVRVRELYRSEHVGDTPSVRAV